MVSRGKRAYFVRLGALSGFDRTLTELGVDPEPLLQAQALSSADLAEGDRLIPLSQDHVAEQVEVLIRPLPPTGGRRPASAARCTTPSNSPD
jgi:hypothetical protein